MKYSVIERDGNKIRYVTTYSCNWLDLLDGTSSKKEYAAKYNTKKEAIEAMNKFIVAEPEKCQVFSLAYE